VKACWCIGVTTGPNFAPDFLTTPDGEMFFGTDYETHYNSNRLGIRFIGPRFQWARTDGGAGGAHPSNVIEVEYAVGTINVTGDMPIAITVDGPSLGGFVCCVTVVEAELWKLGQLRPGDKVRFVDLTRDAGGPGPARPALRGGRLPSYLRERRRGAHPRQAAPDGPQHRGLLQARGGQGQRGRCHARLFRDLLPPGRRPGEGNSPGDGPHCRRPLHPVRIWYAQ